MMGIWSQVSNMAAQTPEDRNRYVDFLRAISILVVITGHWLIATAWYVDGGLSQGHLLKEQPQTQWLTWLFQVMPIFFIVGGYSNAVSLESAKRKGTGYGGWLAARLNRLVAPLLILIVAWAVIAVVMRLMGVTSPVVQFASQAALIPTWFLAIYIMIVILAPHAYRFWRRFGFLSFWIFVAAAASCDALFFIADIKWPGWTNYFWVWLAVHHLGFAWRDGRMGKVSTLLVYAAIGFAVLYLLIIKGPYPLAMVGSPDEGLSNTLPPKITLLALGVFQFGILLALEQPMRRLLDSARLWTATVLVNSMIMTVYLWHITVMVVVVSVLFLLDGFGLRTEPGTTEWWLWRPAWVLLLAVLLVPVALPLSTYERRGLKTDTAIPPVWRQIVGAMLLCIGISLLAMFGYGGGPLPRFMVGSIDLDVGSFLLVIIGAATSGLLPRLRAAK